MHLQQRSGTGVLLEETLSPDHEPYERNGGAEVTEQDRVRTRGGIDHDRNSDR